MIHKILCFFMIHSFFYYEEEVEIDDMGFTMTRITQTCRHCGKQYRYFGEN